MDCAIAECKCQGEGGPAQEESRQGLGPPQSIPVSTEMSRGKGNQAVQREKWSALGAQHVLVVQNALEAQEEMEEAGAMQGEVVQRQIGPGYFEEMWCFSRVLLDAPKKQNWKVQWVVVAMGLEELKQLFLARRRVEQVAEPQGLKEEVETRWQVKLEEKRLVTEVGEEGAKEEPIASYASKTTPLWQAKPNPNWLQ